MGRETHVYSFGEQSEGGVLCPRQPPRGPYNVLEHGGSKLLLDSTRTIADELITLCDVRPVDSIVRASIERSSSDVACILRKWALSNCEVAESSDIREVGGGEVD
jgi:hypothetical protein